MMWIEIVVTLLRTFAYIFLYFLIGFGPGFILGLILANQLLARGQPRYMDLHEEKKQQAAQHNAQWHPSHERWQK